jgi:hypothetical protein
MSLDWSPKWASRGGARCRAFLRAGPRQGRIPGAPRPQRHGTAPNQIAHPHEVVGRVGEQAQMIHSRHAADLRLAQRTDRLAPAEGLLDPLEDALADRVPRMSGSAGINGRAAVRDVLGHVRGGIPTAQLVDEVGAVVAPVGTDCHAMVPRKPRDHVHGGGALPGAAGWGQFVIHDQAVAVLHQDMALVAELRTLAPALAVQPRFRVGLGGMGIVAALLPMEVAFAVAPGTRTRATAVLGPKALHRGPGLDQGAVDTEVFVGQELRPAGLVHHLPEETPGDVGFQQAVPVLGEGGVIPDRVVHGQSDEPAEQQVVVDLLDQQTLGAHRVQDLKERGAQQLLRGNRRAARVRVQRLELGVQCHQRRIHHRPDRAQRMTFGYPRLRRHVAEHRLLPSVLPAHPRFVSYPNPPPMIANGGGFSTAC